MPGSFEGREQIRMVQVDGQKRRPHFAVIACDGRCGLLSAHISEHFVGIKKISRKAAVTIEGLHQGRDFVNRSYMIAKAFLIVGGKVDEVKFPHRLIIPPIKPFSRSLVSYAKPGLSLGVQSGRQECYTATDG